MSTSNGYTVFDLGGNTPLAQRIAHHLKRPLSPFEHRVFDDGEEWLAFQANVRRRDVFFIQPISGPKIHRNLWRLQIAADAAMRASANDITAVIPYYGYARQERKTKGRSPISAALVAKQLKSAGIHRIITIDLHANAIEGQFNGPMDHLWSRTVLLKYVTELYKDDPDVVVVTPDVGGAGRAQAYCVRLTTPATLAIFHKWREVPGTVSGMQLVGHVQRKRCLVVDDIGASGGTVCTAAEQLIEAGAQSVDVMFTHPVLCGKWREHFSNAPIRHIVTTDTIDHDTSTWPPNMKRVSMAQFLAEAIERVYSGASISELFDNPDLMELEVV